MKRKRISVENQLCIGPNFTTAEFALIKRNLSEQKGLRTLSDSLGVAGNLQRLSILYLLHAHREMCVCDLAEVLGISGSAVSQHLRKLKDRNMVRFRRNNQTLFYSLIRNPLTSNLEEIFDRDETREQHTFVLEERD